MNTPALATSLLAALLGLSHAVATTLTISDPPRTSARSNAALEAPAPVSIPSPGPATTSVGIPSSHTGPSHLTVTVAALDLIKRVDQALRLDEAWRSLQEGDPATRRQKLEHILNNPAHPLYQHFGYLSWQLARLQIQQQDDHALQVTLARAQHPDHQDADLPLIIELTRQIDTARQNGTFENLRNEVINTDAFGRWTNREHPRLTPAQALPILRAWAKKPMTPESHQLCCLLLGDALNATGSTTEAMLIYRKAQDTPNGRTDLRDQAAERLRALSAGPQE